mmetsp:Transcript_61190/g.90803  ORF Transcript_61190/g.90803 Transcript_61190/m.90803 type:complete len:743 (+) Transcript_61190:166-2394(+)
MPAKRYTLKSAKNGEKVFCAFYQSAEGCKNGSNCKFIHEEKASRSPFEAAASSPAPSSTKKKRSYSTSSSSVVSSESEGESSMSSSSMSSSSSEEERRSSRKKEKEREERRKSSSTSTSSKKRKEPETSSSREPSWKDLAKIAAPAPDSALVDGAKSSDKNKETPKQSKKDERKSKEKTPKRSEKKEKRPRHDNKDEEAKQPRGFRMLNLPIAPAPDCALVGKAKNSVKDDDESSSSSSDDESAYSSSDDHTETPPLPLPESTPEGRKWRDAVIATQDHPQFWSVFDYARTKDYEQKMGLATEKDWIKARPFGKWCEGYPAAIAMDCEMCQSKCPETGVVNNKALCRISVVNADNPEEILLDTLVKPDWPVTDYRTFVNGIKKEHLEGVTFTFAHAQQFMMALCSEETVVIGHAINNDLMTLKMEHHCVVDSAFLFKYKEPHAHMTPSLANLALGVLGREMPDTHDSVNDSRQSLYVLEEYVKNNGVVEPVQYFPKKRYGNSRDAERACEVFLHRIPHKCKEEHLTAMFLSHTYVQPKDVPIIDFSRGDRGRCPVIFHTPQHALLAYETLETEEYVGNFGVRQKKVFLRDGDYICLKRPGVKFDRKKKGDFKKKKSMDRGAPASDRKENKEQKVDDHKESKREHKDDEEDERRRLKKERKQKRDELRKEREERRKAREERHDKRREREPSRSEKRPASSSRGRSVTPSRASASRKVEVRGRSESRPRPGNMSKSPAPKKSRR